jgi:hypothetical protein
MTLLQHLASAAILLSLLSCTRLENVRAQEPPALWSGPEFRTLFFGPGLPKDGEPLDASAAEPAVADADVLRNARIILAAHPNARFRVVGHTDNRECPTVVACQSLGLRRARVTQSALEKHGVGSDRLAAAASLGSTAPIADNRIADERGFNRRTSIEFVVEPTR